MLLFAVRRFSDRLFESFCQSLASSGCDPIDAIFGPPRQAKSVEGTSVVLAVATHPIGGQYLEVCVHFAGFRGLLQPRFDRIVADNGGFGFDKVDKAMKASRRLKATLKAE